MLNRTRGIALKTTNYSESSVVAQIYTENLGLQSYLINGARKPKAKIPTNMLQPLHLLDMVVYVKDNGTLQRIKEAQASPSIYHIPTDIAKSAVALFINEILFKVLKQQSPDPRLFSFIHDSILWLDQTPNSVRNFHLCFLMKLSFFLGYMPSTQVTDKPFFDLADGVFTDLAPAHTYVLQEPHTSIFKKILTTDYAHAHELAIPHVDRIYLLEQIINFYKLHTEDFGKINSLAILEDIFH